jgi:RimJ/RimL family protein N-acetyltransferase
MLREEAAVNEPLTGPNSVTRRNSDTHRNAAPGTVLETVRLVLREFSAADLDHLTNLDADPEVLRYLSSHGPPSRATVKAEILPRLIDEYALHPGFGRWAVQEKVSGAFVGWASLDLRREAPRAAELGYRLRRAAWGRGYATEVSRALIQRAFAHLDVDRVFATTMAVNMRSRRVLEKAGLRHVRTFHLTFEDPIEGTEYGEVEYSLERGADSAAAGGLPTRPHIDEVHPMTTSLAEALLADEPLAAESARLALFGQFVGAWDLEWHGPGRDGSQIVIAGELHFGWILGGRAIQDVWRVPSSPSDAGLMRGFHSSTIRFYDAAIDAWRSTWLNPLNGSVRRFIGRPTDDGIVLDGLDDDPHLLELHRIEPDSFTWIGEVSVDGGSTWVGEEVMYARRRPSSTDRI